MARKRHSFHYHLQSVLNWRRQRWLWVWLVTCLCVLLPGLSLPGIGLPGLRPDRTLASQPRSIAQSAPISAASALQQGRELYQDGQFAAAATLWQQASEAFSQQGDRLQQAMALSNLSLAHQQLGKFAEAKTAITASLQLVAKEKSPDGLQVLAQAWSAQGSLDLATGQPNQALTAWQQAEKYYAAVNDRENFLRNQINQAQALRALGLYRRSFKLLMAVNQSLQAQPDSLLKVAGLRSLGNTLLVTGDLPQARQNLEQSLAIARSLNAAPDITAAYLSLGNIARAQQQPTDALIFYQQAAATTIPFARLQAQLNHLNVLIEQQQFTIAQRSLPGLQAELQQLAPSHAGVFAQINFVQALLQLGQTSEVTSILDRAIQQARSLNDRQAESYALGVLGKHYEQIGDPTAALAVTQQALALAQAINAADIAYQWQWQLGRLLRTQNQTQTAIATYTEAVNTLRSLRNDLVTINPDVQFSFREQVEPVYRQLVDLLLSPDASPENLSQARSVIESLQLAELENFLQEACLQAQPVQIDRVDAQAAVIYPILLENRLEVLLSAPGLPLRHYSTPVPRTEVEQQILRLRQTLSPIADARERDRLSRQAYDWLIRPLEADLAQTGSKTLVFVLDGALRNFPMAALSDGSQFLVEKYTLALTPGLQLLDPQPLARQKLQVLTGGLTEARQGFAALPGVAKELRQIRAEIPSQLLLNQDLTNAKLTDLVETIPFNVVHLATHGQFSSRSGETFLLTWDDRLNVKQLNDLLQNRDKLTTTPLELLVLSACQTASGDDRAALGLAGLAVRSGARSTIATLWSVNDAAAAVLMTSFYQELAKPGTTKAEALRRAQLSTLSNPQFKSPYYWAPFILVGNWL
jgi:CHAT domain-containing protein